MDFCPWVLEQLLQSCKIFNTIFTNRSIGLCGGSRRSWGFRSKVCCSAGLKMEKSKWSCTVFSLFSWFWYSAIGKEWICVLKAYRWPYLWAVTSRLISAGILKSYIHYLLLSWITDEREAVRAGGFHRTRWSCDGCYPLPLDPKDTIILGHQ